MASNTVIVRSAFSKLVAGVLALNALGFVFGQGFTASISGTARDITGAVLPETAVRVRHLETGLTRAAQTDSGGAYRVPSLPVGQYEVTGERMGFRREVRQGIDLVVGQDAVVDLYAAIGKH